MMISCYYPKLGLRASLAMLAARLGDSAYVTQCTAVLGEHVRVPVIKLVMSSKAFNLAEWVRLKIDITIDDEHQSSQLQLKNSTVQQLLIELPLLRPLVLITKQLLEYYDLNDAYSGGLSSYVWFLMVVAFIQRAATQQQQLSLSGLLLELLSHYGQAFDPENPIRPYVHGLVVNDLSEASLNQPQESLRVHDPVTGEVHGGGTFQFDKIRSMFEDTRQLFSSSESAFNTNETLLAIFDIDMSRLGNGTNGHNNVANIEASIREHLATRGEPECMDSDSRFQERSVM